MATLLTGGGVAHNLVVVQSLESELRVLDGMVRHLRLGQRLIACCMLGLSLGHAPAGAAVEIRFYSKELGASFPHAFVELEGKDDRTGEKVHANYGFTAKALSPAILMGSVTGDVMSVSGSYVRSSDRHFSFVLTDAEYDKVKATIEKWRKLKQPSYNLNRQNCVFFVGDVAASLGMRADTPKALMKKPRSYSEFLVASNRSWLAERGASLDARYVGAASEAERPLARSSRR